MNVGVGIVKRAGWINDTGIGVCIGIGFCICSCTTCSCISFCIPSLRFSEPSSSDPLSHAVPS